MLNMTCPNSVIVGQAFDCKIKIQREWQSAFLNVFIQDKIFNFNLTSFIKLIILSFF